MNYDQARQVGGLMTRLAALEAWRDAMFTGIKQQMPFTLDGRHHLVLADNEAARRAVLDAVLPRIGETRRQLATMGVVEDGDARHLTLTAEVIQAGADALEVRGAPARIAEAEASEVFTAMAEKLGFTVVRWRAREYGQKVADTHRADMEDESLVMREALERISAQEASEPAQQ